MSLLKVNVVNGLPQPQSHETLDAAIARNLAQVPPRAPIIVLIHGYKFSPATSLSDPHRHIFALRPRRGCWKALSWPKHLGFGKGHQNEGLCIALGWEARGSIWRAWRNAQQAGDVLARVIQCVRDHRPCPVHIVAHSLGARVALAAIPALPAGSIGRAVLMAPAEFQSTAAAMLGTPAGQTAEFINITSRENDLFDTLVEWLLPAPSQGDRCLGAGLWLNAGNWLDIQMDCRRTRSEMSELGYRTPAPTALVCHWWAYLRPGLLRFYGDLIRDPERLNLAMLKHALPSRTRPRWSRIWEAVVTLRPNPGRRRGVL
ncbi:hypothetical protein AIOL_001474 [Candidatus Rhodobacter oscarellae]|uniref:AB hydrolase-1 domain-containing protein n=1 Tax=Candidatus Rhodobacter oscarellae TaxID=1675527 RepID=A0A0J9E1A6_9RHOB|nr:alpha/beta fold hydrolase [Candidatus Rhodobacter lobularis]KMW56520.1 hypothetical protein AIOL_001474 [Candidatus Rhodobacter lobularis]